MAAIVKRIRDLPGYELFQYVGEDGERRSIDSADVNDYIREAAGDVFTSKDFRTWAGTLLAARALGAAGPFESRAHAMRNVNEAVESVARQLGNTKAVCRKCYVHPAVVEAYLEGRLQGAPRGDAAVIALLRKRPAESLARQLKRSISTSRRSRRKASVPYPGAGGSRARLSAPPT
jgi:DNA topoisomerase-1